MSEQKLGERMQEVIDLYTVYIWKERNGLIDPIWVQFVRETVDLEVKLEAMERLVVFAQHDYRCEARNGVESCACGYDNALAAAQQEKEDE